MRLGIFLVRFPASSETFIVTKLLGLVESGVDVTIFTQQTSEDWGKFKILENREDIRQRVVQLPQIGIRGLWTLSKILTTHPVRFAQLIIHCYKKRHENPVNFFARAFILSGFLGHKLDIIHVEFDFQGILIADAKEFLGCKLVMSARGSQFRTSIPHLYPKAFCSMLMLADGYHTISKYLHREIIRLGLPQSTPVWLIEPAIDIALFSPQRKLAQSIPKKSDCLRILSVARLSWAKGYEFAMDALYLLHQRDIRFHYTVVGDGDYKEAIRFAALQNGLLELGLITFVGKAGREEVKGFYESADVFLHLSLDEGFANAVIEAQAMGLPVVCSDAGGLVENVEDGVTGFVVPRRNAELACERLLELALNPELRERMGEAGVQRVRNRFNIEDQIPKFLQMYDTVMGLNDEN